MLATTSPTHTNTPATAPVLRKNEFPPLPSEPVFNGGFAPICVTVTISPCELVVVAMEVIKEGVDVVVCPSALVVTTTTVVCSVVVMTFSPVS